MEGALSATLYQQKTTDLGSLEISLLIFSALIQFLIKYLFLVFFAYYNGSDIFFALIFLYN